MISKLGADFEIAEGSRPEGWPDLAGHLTDFGHELAVRVYYEDTDFSGIVYHASYLRFIERGRSDYIRLLGVFHSDLASGKAREKLNFALRKMEINYLKPAHIDDVLIVESRIKEVRGARMVIDQLIRRGEETLFTAMVVVAIIDAEGRPKRIPQKLRDMFMQTKRA